MFKNLRLWAKLMLGLGSTILVVIALLTYTNLSEMSALILDAERDALETHRDAIVSSVESEARRAQSLATLLANLPTVQARFRAGDRQGLAAELEPAFERLRLDADVLAVDFHAPPAVSFLRLHDPLTFGDDESAVREIVAAANRLRVPLAGLESGADGFGIRGVAPVLHEGRPLGTVQVAIDFDRAVLGRFKTRHGIDLKLHVPDGNGFRTVATTDENLAPLPLPVLQRLMEGDTVLDHDDSGDTPYALFAARVLDFEGRPVAVLQMRADRSIYLDAYESSRRNAVLEGLGSILVGLVIAMAIARPLVRRIEAVIAGLDQVALGNLASPIVVEGRDEIGALATATNEMRQRLHDLVAEVGAHAAAVNAVAQEISSAVEHQAASSAQMSSSVAEITSTMEELSASSSEIAENSNAVVGVANETLLNSRSGAEGVQNVLGRMNDIRVDNQHNLREIIELGAKSKEIGKVMEIINTIADQTRLIAFNAALEASSAGEAGKRFSVVAAEIRRLADSVTDSTGEIEARVGEIQDSISRLVITSDKGAGVIAGGIAASAESAEKLEEIVTAAAETSSAAQQISLSTQQQKTASSQVVVALREIVTANAYTAKSTARIVQVGKDMSRLSAALFGAASKFTYEPRAGAGPEAAPRATVEAPERKPGAGR